MLNYDSFYDQAFLFLKNVFRDLENVSFPLPQRWHLDHLCWRTDTLKNYELMKEKLNTFSTLIHESKVNGRNISTFELAEPIRFLDHIIYNIELPAPKASSQYANGFEHLEIVCDIELRQLKILYPHLKWENESLKKFYNQESKLKLSAGSVKFHNQSLASVIRLEAQTKVYCALYNSKILEALETYCPLVVGTFPLGIAVPKSDIDIVISHKNLSEVYNKLVFLFSAQLDFRIERLSYASSETVFCHFSFENIPFEVFAQNSSSFEQNGYRHFLIEERLLKVGKERFLKKIIEEKMNGLKTEPAFTNLIGLAGDPYGELLKLADYSDSELEQMTLAYNR